MNQADRMRIAQQVIDKTRSMGASLIGIADIELLKKSPSHDIYAKIEPNRGVGSRDYAEGVAPGKVAWPPNARSALVVALAHPEEDPQLDWWIEDDDERESHGCRILQDILEKVSVWMDEKFNIKTHKLSYHLEKGGIFLKDAGVLAGMGCIGKNNLLVTPQYGPRVRIWAMLLDAALPPTGPIIYDPCDGCEEPCRPVCPQKAFDRAAYSPIEMGMVTLPGRDGCYEREDCRLETEKNIENKIPFKPDANKEPLRAIAFCRHCEFACPVGKK